MPYSQIQFSAIKQELANRLNDPTKTRYVDSELGLYIQDAIRFWNCLTGEFKQVWPLQVNPGIVWYDLQTLNQTPVSPRLATVTDRDVYTRIMYQLLEGSSSTAVPVTNQFTQDDIIQSVQRKRDEFIFRTGCTSVVESLPVTPNTETLILPQTVIQVRRSYWLPIAIPGFSSTASPVFKNDEYATAAYGASLAVTPGTPVGFSPSMEPQLTLDMTPPPDRPGNLECLTIESQAALSAAQATTLLMPSDFIQAIQWGALADIYAMSQQKQDATRAAFCNQRYEEYVALMQYYAFVYSARVNGLPVFVDAVETLDYYAPNWRNLSVQPQIVGISGKNLVAFPTSQAAQITLMLCANAVLPINDTDFIQLGIEVIDAVLDEAQSTAMQKCGGQEAVIAGNLHGNMIKLAAKKRDKIRAMSIFSDILYGVSMREDKFIPQEVEAVQN